MEKLKFFKNNSSADALYRLDTSEQLYYMMSTFYLKKRLAPYDRNMPVLDRKPYQDNALVTIGKMEGYLI